MSFTRTDFPTALDTIAPINPTDLMDDGTYPHSEWHNTVQEAAMAVQIKVGVDGSADTTSHDYKLSRITSGTYTPTLTNVANITASTAYQCQWMRAGNVVTVSGRVAVDPTLGLSTQLGISLPVASNLGAAENCAGAAFAPAVAGLGAAILGDATNDRAQMQWVAVDLTNQSLYFSFTYLVI